MIFVQCYLLFYFTLLCGILHTPDFIVYQPHYINFDFLYYLLKAYLYIKSLLLHAVWALALLYDNPYLSVE